MLANAREARIAKCVVIAVNASIVWGIVPVVSVANQNNIVRQHQTRKAQLLPQGNVKQSQRLEVGAKERQRVVGIAGSMDKNKIYLVLNNIENNFRYSTFSGSCRRVFKFYQIQKIGV